MFAILFNKISPHYANNSNCSSLPACPYGASTVHLLFTIFSANSIFDNSLLPFVFIFPSARSCFAAAAVAVAVAVAAVQWHRFLLFGCVHPAGKNCVPLGSLQQHVVPLLALAKTRLSLCSTQHTHPPRPVSDPNQKWSSPKTTPSVSVLTVVSISFFSLPRYRSTENKTSPQRKTLTHTQRGRSVPCVLYLPFCASWRNQTTTKGSPFLPRSAPTFYSTHTHKHTPHPPTQPPTTISLCPPLPRSVSPAPCRTAHRRHLQRHHLHHHQCRAGVWHRHRHRRPKRPSPS